MRKLLITSLALVATLAIGEIANACTATGVYDRATRIEDSEIYDTVRDVIETDSGIQRENWQDPDATHAAVGTVLREAWNRDGSGSWGNAAQELSVYERLLSTTGSVRSLLNKDKTYPHNGIKTVRDHAIMHGNDWENGAYSGAGRPAGRVWNPPVQPPVDHAG